MGGSVGARLTVRLTPRGGRDAIEGPDTEGVLRVRVAAPPADGAANRSMLRLLAADLDLAPSALRLVSGASGRRKVVEVEGRTAAELVHRYPGLAV
jgi:uncharacterized protein YggU (UPF0235/DUF167 family)